MIIVCPCSTSPRKVPASSLLRRGSTVLLATHDRELIRASGRRCITLEQGRLGDERPRVLERPHVREGLFGLGG